MGLVATIEEEEATTIATAAAAIVNHNQERVKSTVPVDALKSVDSNLSHNIEPLTGAPLLKTPQLSRPIQSAQHQPRKAPTFASRISNSSSKTSCEAISNSAGGDGGGGGSKVGYNLTAATTSTKSYLTHLLGRSSILLHSLKQQYSHMQQQQQQQPTDSGDRLASSSCGTAAPTPSGATPTATSHPPLPVPPATPSKHSTRRHALQEQSLERDAALSLKVSCHNELKHKRTSSIKGALRHAHLGVLTRSATSDKRGGSGSSHQKDQLGSSGGGDSGGNSQLAQSMPYALFELPVTQRTFQRTRRRGAMLADPKRQLSADTIGLRQLTDEYLHNAGVVPFHSSANGTLVQLNATSDSMSSTVGGSTSERTGSGEFPLQSQLFQVSGASGATNEQVLMAASSSLCSSNIGNRADDEANSCAEQVALVSDQLTCQVLPGSLPWQRDVCVQCELIRTPQSQLAEPYETTGDILDTIAGPFRGGCATLNQTSSFESTNQLSATLKRGLTAISQHHLSPVAGAPVGSSAAVALNAVVGNLKKSLSNTLDISRQVAAAQHNLHSQDSLPAYSSLRNEPEPDELENEPPTSGGLELPDNGGGGGLIGQLTSKLSMQPSKKFSVSRKGLQRALSFDCRGYKRLEAGSAQQRQQSSKDSTGSGHQVVVSAGGSGANSSSGSQRNHHLLSTKQASHNRSTLGLNSDQSPRPYLPQSASQVDFQLPLLPYHKMQEAIVSNRRLDRNETSTVQSSIEGEAPGTQQLEADEMLCAQQPSNLELATPVEPERLIPQDTMMASSPCAVGVDYLDSSGGGRRKQQPPLLVLDIPTISTPTPEPLDGDAQVAAADDCTEEDQHKQVTNNGLRVHIKQNLDDDDDDDEDDGGEEVCANSNDQVDHLVMASLLPGGPGANYASPGMSNSPSFCLEPQLNGSKEQSNGGASNNLLTASDVFSRSKIKRPSTMVTSDAMNQVAQALNNSSSAANHHRQQQQQRTPIPSPGISADEPVVLRNRRSAIVPPKLTTDANGSPDNEAAQEGKLVDVDNDNDEINDGDHLMSSLAANAERRHSTTSLTADEELRVKALRRKRSGGGPVAEVQQRSPSANQATSSTAATQQHQQQQQAANAQRQFGGSQTNLPTFYIEATCEDQQPGSEQVSILGGTSSFRQTSNEVAIISSTQRPDSQMTNVDSIASSSSSANLSLSGKRGEFTVTSPGGLTVSFGSTRGRRRSSIAVIPQMQICPGDLLVYSKQLIDRMNQSDEPEPPQFLTIDDKKGKNIWSSFKLCAQFDNRTLKARNELLCSLEDVLASLQPSTFVDEQLSHYKGMLWNEFLYETESRRSASHEALAAIASGAEMAPLERHQGGDGFDGATGAATTTSAAIDLQMLSDSLQLIIPATAVAAAPTEVDNGSKHKPLGKTASVKALMAAADVASSLTAPTATCSTGANVTSIVCSAAAAAATPITRDPIKQSMSSGPHHGNAGSGQVSSTTPVHRGARDPAVRSISSRFKEKPKLKRGQTVDSVFRIPLIPSSPLKHAQQHQQTPTAHLEEHHAVDLSTIEDDERSSPGGRHNDADGAGSLASGCQSPTTTSRDANNNNNNNNNNINGTATTNSTASPSTLNLSKRNRSASTRSRSGSTKTRQSQQQQQLSSPANPQQSTTGGVTTKVNSKEQQQQQQQVDSSFEADDTLDLITNSNSHGLFGSRNPTATPTRHWPSQMVRQSSLSTLSSTITRTEQKRQRALWDLFQSECTFFFDHLMTLKNVYMEPLKKIQVEGFAMFADPDVLFGNLDELCCGVYDFCKEFLYIIMRTVRTRPEELNATDVLIKLYKKNPKIDHLRGVYHRYTLNYINALTYLESLRRQVEFVEFEKWSSRDVRCKKLQLTDLLVAPVQHIMRVPIILRDIESHTETPRDRDEIRAILAVEEASLRELDDKMRWLKNFERLLEIQKNISWPNVLELDPKLFIPEFLKEVLSKQPCEKLIVSPRRQIVHEGTLSNFDYGRACDMHVILFDDMLLLTRRKKGLTKKASTVGKTNSGGSSTKDDGSFKYIVYKQPLSLDRFYVHDVQQADAQALGMKHFFVLIVMNRFQQLTHLHSFSAPNDELKQTWLFKIKKTSERWKKNLSSNSGEQSQEQSHLKPNNNNPNVNNPQTTQNNQSTSDQKALHQSRTVPDCPPKTASN